MNSKNISTTPIGLYFHIPFCIQLCRYCDFNKVLRNQFTGEDIRAYQKAMLSELEFYLNKYLVQINTIYFGGGTPSLYPKEYIRELIDYVRQKKLLSGRPEISIEIDPKTIRKRSLIMLKETGINRISIGAQSFNNHILETLGRYHRMFDINQCFEDCRDAGFDNISLDLIYGVPGQTKEIWINDLINIQRLNPEHVSLYNLTLARGTEIFRKRKKIRFPADSLQLEFYKMARRALKKIGIRPYEISNFSKPDFESRHNMDCWNYKSYFGIGAGASSFYNERRWRNIIKVRNYIACISEFHDAVSEAKKLNLNDMKLEFVMLGLRKTEGFLKSEYLKKWGSEIEKDFPELFSDEINSLIKSSKRIKLTYKGINLSNEAFETLF